MPGRREENAGKRMLKHLSAILEKSGVIIFEYLYVDKIIDKTG